jgi:thymidylate synthase
MLVIRAPSIGRAHELIVEKIFDQGNPMVTEDFERCLELKEQSNIFLANPFAEPMISKKSDAKKGYMSFYTEQLLEGTSNEFEYTYHDRLFHFPVQGYENGFDQIDWMVKKLIEDPSSRRVQATTWIPGVDNFSRDPPCLQRIQCFLREDDYGVERLNMLANFRSNDMIEGANNNMYALVHLQKKKIADPLSVEIGWYSHTSDSSHGYIKKHLNSLIRMITTYENSQGELVEDPRRVIYFKKRMDEIDPIFRKIEYEMGKKGLHKK